MTKVRNHQTDTNHYIVLKKKYIVGHFLFLIIKIIIKFPLIEFMTWILSNLILKYAICDGKEV